MACSVKRLVLPALAGVAAWTLAGLPAYGQVMMNPANQAMPAMPINPAAANMALGRAAVPPGGFGFNPGFQGFAAASPAANPVLAGLGPYASLTSTGPLSPYTSPYASQAYGGGYNPYYPYPYSYADPYGGGLRGAAEAINAQGQFEVQFQQARLMNQEVQRSKLDTRRRAIDEWLYERANLPTLQDIREQALRMEQRRVRNTPDLTDLVSGYAINVLLDELAKRPNLPASSATIDPALLKQVNVKAKGTAGNLSALKPAMEGGALNWPLPLQGADFQDESKRLNAEAAEAVKLAQNTGQVDPAVLNNMLDEIRKLRAKVSNRVNELTYNQSVEANRFLNQLNEAVTALQNPNVASVLNPKLGTKAKTVPELIKYLAGNGLEIAPAGSGDEAAYAALHNYFVSYANGLQESSVNTTGPRGKE
jgi:hypothetical protein